MLRPGINLVFFVLTIIFCNHAQARYRRAVSGLQNVLDKIYPKVHKIEFDMLNAGIILNQSYVDSILLSTRIGFFTTETIGYHLEVTTAINSNKSERDCLEQFYNDPENLVSAPCPSPGTDPAAPLLSGGSPVKGANFGPAYVPIRELKYIITANMTWNPVYGKQIAFLSFTNHFDIFFNMGLGVAISDFYPKSTHLRNGVLSRGPIPADFPGGCPSSPGVCPSNPQYKNLIGVAGRPNVKKDTTPLISLGIGQRFHFLKHFLLRAELRSFTLVGSELGYEQLFAVLVGAGMRF